VSLQNNYFSDFKEIFKGQFIDQWKQIFLKLDLVNFNLSLPAQNIFEIRIATKEDIPVIKLDIYPLFENYGQYDKKYIESIGQEGMECLIAIIDNKIVHYFFVFDSALKSPIVRTPISKNLILHSDASLGSQFTSPKFRGKSISIYSLAEIIKYLQNQTKAKRVLTTIHSNTSGALKFHKRLGFNEIEYMSSKTIFFKLEYIFFKLFPLFINKFNQEVEIEDHQALQKKILNEISSYIELNFATINKFFLHKVNTFIDEKHINDNSIEFKNEIETLIQFTINQGLDSFLKEDDINNVFIELLLLDKKNQKFNLNIDQKTQNILKKEIEILLGDASWQGSEYQLKEAHIFSRVSFLSLNFGILESDIVNLIIEKLIFKLSYNQWFTNPREIYGKSFLLRSIINLCSNNPSHKFHDYLQDVCDHLLKRMEIKRESLILPIDGKHDFSVCLLEQLRINKALLEAGVLFNDVRFLNAVMKSNDRIYNMVSKIKLPTNNTNINNISIALYYNDIMNSQEKLYSSLL
jgi:hypothetical protein